MSCDGTWKYLEVYLWMNQIVRETYSGRSLPSIFNLALLNQQPACFCVATLATVAAAAAAISGHNQ